MSNLNSSFVLRVCFTLCMSIVLTACIEDADPFTSGDSYSGNVVKGPLENALVFLDYNDDGIQDGSEPSAITDVDGGFTLKPSNANFTIVAITSSVTVDGSSGEVLDGVTLKAPSTASVITPTTTLMQEGDLTADQVAEVLGLPAGINPLTFNPYADGVNAADALAVEIASQQVMSVITAFSASAEGAGASQTNAFKAALKAVVEVVKTKATESNSTNRKLDLTMSADLDLIKTQVTAEVANMGEVDQSAFAVMADDTRDAVMHVNDKIKGVISLTSNEAKKVFATTRLLAVQVKKALETEKQSTGTGTIDFAVADNVDYAAAINTAPTDISLSNLSISESASSLVMGTLSSTDAVGEAFTYAIDPLEGTDHAAFTINQNTGALSFVAQPKFGTQNTYSVTIISTDKGGKSYAKPFVLNVLKAITDPLAAAAVLNLEFTPTKNFHFTWTEVADATHYNLFEDASSNGDYQQVNSNEIESTGNAHAFDHIVPLYGRLNARYYLESCNADGCISSPVVHTSDKIADMVSSIGYVKASNTDEGDNFGYIMALSGDGNTLAVGTQYEDSNATGIGGDQSDNSASTSGAVYVFTRSGTTWAQQAYVKASNTETGDVFGRSLSLSSDGNSLAVGMDYEDSNATGIGGDQSDNSASKSGAVYVFTRSGTTWAQQAYVKASNTETGDKFGHRVSLSGDGNSLAVGAPNEDSNATGLDGDQSDNSASNSGAVYFFTRSGTTWTQQAYVKASNAQESDNFGKSLSLSGDGNALAVGAHYEDSNATGINGDQSDNSASDSGAVYVFTRSGTTWTQQAYVKASNTEGSDFFGGSLSLSSDGNSLAVGVQYEDSNATGINGDQSDNSTSDSGAVYIY
jgi:hypothetical protein